MKTEQYHYTLETVAAIAAMVEPELAKIGIHTAIGGSCVYRGGSNKDMDIFLYPHSRDVVIDRLHLVGVLSGFGFHLLTYEAGGKERPVHTQVPDVHVTNGPNGERVDWFFLERHTIAAEPHKHSEDEISALCIP